MKIDIFSGFLGSGKTTLIKKLIKEAYAGEKVVLIENEFGEIGIDGGFLQDAGINITEMNSGCICCSLVGDFSKALKQVEEGYNPDRIIIEPSGVGKLSDVVKAVEQAGLKNSVVNSKTTIVDAGKCKMYMKNFGEFFNDQIKNANCIVLSHTDVVKEEKVALALELIRGVNDHATIVSTPITQLDGKTLIAEIERLETLEDQLLKLKKEVEDEHHHDEECGCHHGHEHHHDEECGCHHGHEHHHDEECGCHHHGHEHHHDEECSCHHGYEHHHDEECGCHHGHEHHHDEECGCHHGHEHHHDHHGHHHADDVFTSWGKETTNVYTKEQMLDILSQIQNEEKFGMVLRAKGIVNGGNCWIHFDYVPEEPDVREGVAGSIGKICVIGCNLKEEELKKLFNL